MSETSPTPAGPRTASPEFVVTSPDLADGRMARDLYAAGAGCGGSNRSPALEWTGVPEGTRSFAVSMRDEDLDSGSGFWHWVVLDVPATATGLPAGAGSEPGSLPPGARHAFNDASAHAYSGICPPPGETHRYRIVVKALGVERLPVAPDATGAMAGYVGNLHALATATLVARGASLADLTPRDTP